MDKYRSKAWHDDYRYRVYQVQYSNGGEGTLYLSPFELWKMMGKRHADKEGWYVVSAVRVPDPRKGDPDNFVD